MPRVGVSPGGTTGQDSTDGKPADAIKPSQEELSRRTYEEDVTELDCSASGRFASSGGRNENDQQNVGHINTATGETAGGHRAVNKKDRPDWRAEDRALFTSIVGPHLATDGSVWSAKGNRQADTFPADTWYNAFRKDSRSSRRIQWPGRFLNELHERGGDPAVEDWLITQGLEMR